MIRVGVLLGVVLSFWSLWGELLPALTVFDKVQVPMTRSVLVDGVSQQVPVTLSHLLFALLVLAGTIFAAKNLSGLLSFTVFQRLETDPGASYAIVTLCQYVIVTLGAVYAFSSLGVAYGSDVQRARALVLEAAVEAEHVLDDLKPSVTFANFGDNSLALELRCYLPSMDNLLITKTAVNDAVYRKFAEAGIVIAFPQRDVHLDVSGPLNVRLERDE